MDNGRFTFGDTEYVVNKASDGVHVYRLGDSTTLGYLTDYVFDSYDDSFKISDEFKRMPLWLMWRIRILKRPV